MTVNISSTFYTIGVMKVMYDAAGAGKFTLFEVSNGSSSSQGDPRSITANNQVVWQRDFKLYCPLQIVGTANKRSQNDYGGLHCCY